MTPFKSITEYLIDSNNCVLAQNGYLSKTCINGNCNECNGIINPHDYEIAPDAPSISFYQFEVVTSTEQTKKGNFTKRTMRVDYNEHPSVCKDLLDKKAKTYLLHRYDYVQDKFMWP